MFYLSRSQLSQNGVATVLMMLAYRVRARAPCTEASSAQLGPMLGRFQLNLYTEQNLANLKSPMFFIRFSPSGASAGLGWASCSHDGWVLHGGTAKPARNEHGLARRASALDHNGQAEFIGGGHPTFHETSRPCIHPRPHAVLFNRPLVQQQLQQVARKTRGKGCMLWSHCILGVHR